MAKACVIFSGVDLSTALLGTSAYAVRGYEPETAETLLQNIVIWSLNRQPLEPALRSASLASSALG